MDTKQKILTAALDCFSEKGYAAASIKDISVAAGIKSSALIYHYFANKEDLFKNCALYFNQDMSSFFDLSVTDISDTKEFLTKFLRGYSGWLNKPEVSKLWNSAFSVITTNPSILRHLLQSARYVSLDLLNQFIYLHYPSLTDKLTNLEIFSFLQMITSPLMVNVMVNSKTAIEDDQVDHDYLIENISAAYSDWFDKQVERIEQKTPESNL